MIFSRQVDWSILLLSSTPKLKRSLVRRNGFSQTSRKGHRHGGTISASDKNEYAKLVVRQLRAHKVALFERVDAWASVFAVGKSSGNQREVWNGANLSSGAAPPPRPPHLANPSCFLDLEALDGDRVRVTKRDARCYFDQLRLPRHLRSWFGRPSLRMSDILRFTDMTIQELESHLPCHRVGLEQVAASDRLEAVVHRDLVLWPVCTTWPMGFAWSSFIAQSQLLGVGTASGLTTERMLADDLDTPADLSAVFALATDDVMLFTLGRPRTLHRGRPGSIRTLSFMES